MASVNFPWLILNLADSLMMKTDPTKHIKMGMLFITKMALQLPPYSPSRNIHPQRKK